MSVQENAKLTPCYYRKIGSTDGKSLLRDGKESMPSSLIQILVRFFLIQIFIYNNFCGSFLQHFQQKYKKLFFRKSRIQKGDQWEPC